MLDRAAGADRGQACFPRDDDPFAEHRSKSLLDTDQQVVHLKSKGVAFNLVGEDEAAAFLTDKTYFFKATAFRTLFERCVGGNRDGQYVNLDFGHIKALASVDRTLRYVLLPMTLDVEHFARTKLMRRLSDRRDEDGYSVVRDYAGGLSHDNRRRREGEVKALAVDAYCGDLVRKYFADGTFNRMPVWAFLELVSFGSFIDFYLFCANRWGDAEMVHEHYRLRQSKACRNAAAHSSNIVNGFAGKGSIVQTDEAVGAAIAEAGVSRRVRAAKMSNPRLQQIATLLYLHSRMVPAGTSRSRARNDLCRLRVEMERVLELIPDNDAVRSSFIFLIALFDKWFMCPKM